MKRISIFLFYFIISFTIVAQKSEKQAIWQQQMTCQINVELMPEENTLKGFVSFHYTNNSPDTLKSIWMHIWPNAYLNNSSEFAKQLLRQDNIDFHFSNPEDKGYIDGFEFKMNSLSDKTLAYTYHPKFQDVIEVKLDRDLLPNGQMDLQTPFFIQLPKLFSRSGVIDGFYSITQWYPKPAVYDTNGWHIMPYLNQGEFYSEFCDHIKVEITVPLDFKVAATGNLDSTIIKYSNGEKKYTYLFSEKKVHDFAWFASEKFNIQEKYIVLENGHRVLLQVFGLDTQKIKSESKILDYMSFCISEFSKTIGNYPYNSCKVVIGPLKAGEGMEYPTITLCKDDNIETIFHEIGHNWFYGMIASNEREYPWMDESLNTYFSSVIANQFEVSIAQDYTRDFQFFNNKKLGHYLSQHSMLWSYQILTSTGKSQAISNASEDFASYNYGIILYGKGPLLFAYLNQVLGDSIFNASIKKYFEDWKYKHPLPNDLKGSFEAVSGQHLDWFFDDLLKNKEDVDVIKTKNGYKIVGSERLQNFIKQTTIDNPNPFGFLPERNYFNNSKKKQLISLSFPFGLPKYNSLMHFDIAPAVGYNYYDKLYFGTIINHHFLYKQGLQFVVLPVYSLSQNKFRGYTRIKGSIFPDKEHIERIELGLKAQTFSISIFEKENAYYVINPFLKIHVKSKKIVSDFQEQYVFINAYHTGLEKKSITVNDSLSFDFPSSYFFNYLKTGYIFDNHHKINRIGFKIQSEYGYNNMINPKQNQYLKSWINLTYKYRYDKKEKYFRTELFAGTFLLKQGNFDRQMFYMTSNSGSMDYLYQEPMLARNENSSGDLLIGNQLINSGGNMRNLIPTFPTDRWMLSINSDLSLPGFLPLKIYFDLGYYKYLSKVMTNSGLILNLKKPELYYTSGLILGCFKNTLEVFLPLVQSNQFKGFSNWNYLNIGNSIGFKLYLNRFDPDEILSKTILTNKLGTSDLL